MSGYSVICSGEKGLDAVLPTKEGERLLNPSKALTLLVAILILGFTFVVYTLAFGEVSELSIYLGWSISAIFFIRVIGDFNMVGVFKKIKKTEFAEYDNKLFIPLCSYLSFSVGVIALQSCK
ncbi:MAG: DUF3995 domain-containing protein [Campylobacterota bacterium]|nr:DUF3995 domain-containing protein [Campylobacterota bacterium]